MSDVLIVVQMVLDVARGYDPTLPSGHNELVPIAQTLSGIRDAVLFFFDHFGN